MLKNRIWTRRKQGHAIGRLTHVNPTTGELFFLRMLLRNKKGVTSFYDLRTVEGVLHGSFRAACEALDLLGNDKEWGTEMIDTSFCASSQQLKIFLL